MKAFAVVREACLERFPYKVQVVGGIVRHGDVGKCVLVKEGDMTALCQVYLNMPLPGKRGSRSYSQWYWHRTWRDWDGWELCTHSSMVFQWDQLGSHLNRESLSLRYYLLNRLRDWFDYLRDNMVVRAETWCNVHSTMRMVDEVDSILIGEARTPLIVSGAQRELKQANSMNAPLRNRGKDIISWRSVLRRLVVRFWYWQGC